ncbi:Stf0 sulfotransferase family protein [Jannaschia sp. M317]|uniref:Stf0 sulfotransferase family protein n=1 Tax=Jannaschia sp. M317 TaxID=2867011 RepID=UPI0021A2BE2A|nr:Stf0 sulfotransferase family protein [Jannaschia sp. M317]UWQ17526.1 Stf0 sulfotransferase family protein [Jannaschia sp. M317]
MKHSLNGYVICTLPRSGSTLLCQLLQSVPGAGQPGSHFHRTDVAAWAATHGLPPLPMPASPADLRRILAAGRQTGCDGDSLFGLRLQSHSRAYLLERLAEAQPGLPCDRTRLEATFGHLCFIYLTRRDHLAQAISYVRAAQTGLWHRAADGREMERSAPPAPSRYDRAAITDRLQTIATDEQQWQVWFARQGIEPLRVFYEDLAADPARTLDRILRHLGLAGMSPTLRIPTARLADGTSLAWARRYRSDASGD